MEIIDIGPDDPRLLAEVYPVLHELRPHLTPDLLVEVYTTGHAEGLRFTAAYDSGRCVGVAGWRIVNTTHAIRKLYVDDLVTTGDRRSRGVGRALLTELADRARATGCRTLELDSGVHRADAHRFYMREGLTIPSFHFARTLTPG